MSTNLFMAEFANKNISTSYMKSNSGDVKKLNNYLKELKNENNINENKNGIESEILP